MSFFKIFDIAGSGMSAQQIRLNVTASNMANIEAASNRASTTYKVRHPIFESVLDSVYEDGRSVGVRVREIVSGTEPPLKRYEPNHPLADDKGYIYVPNINVIEEMANMISASRAFQNNTEILNVAKQMMIRTLSLGQ